MHETSREERETKAHEASPGFGRVCGSMVGERLSCAQKSGGHVKRTVQVVERPLITSERHPEIFTNRVEFEEAFAWADDECPIAWKIVREAKSKAWGKHASCYVCAHTDSPEDVAMRLSIFHERVTGKGPFVLEGENVETIWNWNARFTIENYGDKKVNKKAALTGGFFQQHAPYTYKGETKEYARNCTTLDYTPNKLDEVLDQFQRWYEARNERGELSGFPNTTRITLDGKTVREFKVEVG